MRSNSTGGVGIAGTDTRSLFTCLDLDIYLVSFVGGG